MTDYMERGEMPYISPADRQWREGHYNLEIRWLPYEDFAEEKVNFYNNAFRAALELTTLGPSDTVYDIGSGDAIRFNNAARELGISSHIVGVDKFPQAYEQKSHHKGLYLPNFSFVEAPAEDMHVIPSNSGRLIISNHSIYEVPKDSIPDALAEIHRIAEADAIVVVSTNGKYNKPGQRADEEVLTDYFGLPKLEAPAESFYSEHTIAKMTRAGFQFIRRGKSQDCRILWPPDAFEVYAQVLQTRYDSLGVNVPRAAEWMNAAMALIERRFKDRIEPVEVDTPDGGKVVKLFSVDRAVRDQFIFRALKRAA